MSHLRAIAGHAVSFTHVTRDDRRQKDAANDQCGRDQVFLILDARGLVKFCSDPRVLRTQEGELLGKSITAFVPGLPLRATTPGYNIAYVRFTYADDTRHRLMLKMPSGASRPVDVAVRPILIDRGHCLLVQLRLVREAVGNGGETVALSRAQAVIPDTAEACC